MKNIKDYNLDELQEELINMGEKNSEQSKYLNGYTKRK